MLWSSTSKEGIDGNLLEALDDLKGDELSGDGLSGDDLDGDDLDGEDLDGEDLARDGRGFRPVDMVT